MEYSIDSNERVSFINTSRPSNFKSSVFYGGFGTIYDTNRNPVIQYPNPGEYFTSLSIVPPSNQRCGFDDTISVNHAQIDWLINNNVVNIEAISYGVTIDSIQWNFGDSSISRKFDSTISNSSIKKIYSTYHKYDSTGQYTLLTQFQNEFGIIFWDTTLVIYEECIANFSKSLDTIANSVILANHSSQSPGTTYNYNFGDGSGWKGWTSSRTISHTYANYGTYNVCIRTQNFTNGQRCSTEFCDSVGLDSLGNLKSAGFTVQFVDSNTIAVGVEDVLDEAQLDRIKIYPNPSTSIFKMEFDNTIENLELTVFNSIGKAMIQKQSQNTLSEHLDLGNFAHGIYYLHITDGVNQRIEKLIKY
jgi:hypothetical protein